VFGLLIIGISMLCLFSLTISFFVLYTMNGSGFSEATHMLVDSHTTLVLFSIGFLLFFGAPLIALIYLGLKLMLGERSRVKWLKSALLILWFAGLVLLVTTAYKIGTNFKMEGSNTETIALMQPAKGGLYVQIANSSGKKAYTDNEDEDEYHDINIDYNGIFVNGINLKDLQRIPVGRPKLEILPSENDSFYIQELITSQGRNKMDAEKNTEMVSYNFSQTDSILNLSPQLYLEKGNKYRAQRIKLKLAIPEGKTLRFADNIDTWYVTAKGVSPYDEKNFANTVWTVEKGQLKCLNAQPQTDDKQDAGNQEEHERPADKKEHKKDKDEDTDNTQDF
jgi:hypothetical protein